MRDRDEFCCESLDGKSTNIQTSKQTSTFPAVFPFHSTNFPPRAKISVAYLGDLKARENLSATEADDRKSQKRRKTILSEDTHSLGFVIDSEGSYAIFAVNFPSIFRENSFHISCSSPAKLSQFSAFPRTGKIELFRCFVSCKDFPIFLEVFRVSCLLTLQLEWKIPSDEGGLSEQSEALLAKW
jgi:hypothetical protein